MFKAAVTSKGQITIPKEVREHLELEKGSIVSFSLQNTNREKNVLMIKDFVYEECTVCKGEGKINESMCIVCRESGEIKKELLVMEEILFLMQVGRAYGISVLLLQDEYSKAMLAQQETLDTHATKLKTRTTEYPIIRLKGDENKYSQETIHIFNDFYQKGIIREFSPRSTSNPNKFMIPSDIILDEIVSLLFTSEAKEEVTSWFDRN
ncbi:AbrB family transcriptional regulator (plasmid) [Bacillus mycoides]|uniref:AbrB family transcriptional regulator n=1 Tax=Bacillus mycoides TaxID=1405 RepID=A0A1W6AJC1_BACMY|nr:AbrB/MazE/SpoVT family DNA-binding domain-containing protein [Bacillus mycoides]ARJ25937.1 AbrB family transcriptional regulator [Bacillus mycoides]